MDFSKLDQATHQVNGLYLSKNFGEETVLKAMEEFEPQPDDIIICTYPKCGTTWMQQIVLLILNKGQPIEDFLNWSLASPFLELHGLDAIDRDPRPKTIKTHLSLKYLKWNPETKYIYVARNPIDCCISYFYHARLLWVERDDDLQFDEFFERFLSEEISYGSYIDHLLGFYQHYGEQNLFFVTYEELKNQPEKVIKDLAYFIGEEYGQMVDEDSEVLDNILKYSSIGYMKEHYNAAMKEFFETSVEDLCSSCDVPEGLLRFRIRVGENLASSNKEVTFVREGKVGDSASVMNKEQVRRLVNELKSRDVGEEILKLWSDLCLPADEDEDE